MLQLSNNQGHHFVFNLFANFSQHYIEIKIESYTKSVPKELALKPTPAAIYVTFFNPISQFNVNLHQLLNHN